MKRAIVGGLAAFSIALAACGPQPEANDEAAELGEAEAAVSQPILPTGCILNSDTPFTAIDEIRGYASVSGCTTDYPIIEVCAVLEKRHGIDHVTGKPIWLEQARSCVQEPNADFVSQVSAIPHAPGIYRTRAQARTQVNPPQWIPSVGYFNVISGERTL
jgi:hypothetical protein